MKTITDAIIQKGYEKYKDTDFYTLIKIAMLEQLKELNTNLKELINKK
jgi:hypothetical protein